MLKDIFFSFVIMFVVWLEANGQLGFCSGNSGGSIFSEKIGVAPSFVTKHVIVPKSAINLNITLSNVFQITVNQVAFNLVFLKVQENGLFYTSKLF
jgi:hypothetical protein